MARIRSIKPDFWDSPSTAKASLRARLLYIAMWNWADDWGVGDANPRRLLSFAFPNDDDAEIEPRNFRHLAAEVSECFHVTWYEADGREWYEVPTWEEHQRTEKRAQRKNPASDQAERILYAEVSENPSLNRGKPHEGSRKWEVGSGKWEEDSSSQVADATSRPADRPDVDELLDYLDTAIRANGAKTPSRTKANHDAIRLLLDRDGKTAEQIRAAIDYATGNEFWRSNILSAKKLREKYDQLRMSAERDKWKRPGGKRQQERAEFWEAEMNAAREYDEAHNRKEIEP